MSLDKNLQFTTHLLIIFTKFCVINSSEILTLHFPLFYVEEFGDLKTNGEAIRNV